MTSPHESDRWTHAGNWVLWIVVLGPPALWLLQLQAIYAMVLPACHSGLTSLVYAPGAFFVGVAIFVVAIAVWAWHKDGFAHEEDRESHAGPRRRFMATYGLFSSILFAIIIAAQTIPMIYFGPCAGLEP